MAGRIREARESRGLSYRQIADETKLSTRVICALEEGRVDDLPGGIYRRSLVRAIAHEVGLEPEEVLREFLEECPDDLPAPGQSVRVASPAPAPVRRLPWRRLMAALGAVVPVLAGIAYFWNTPERPEPRIPPAVTATYDVDTWRPEIAPAGGFTEPPPPATRPMTMMITVSSRCQLRIIADGRVVAGRTFDAGESLRVNFGDAVELSGDNAGVVQFSVNGRAGRLLGALGEPLAARIGRDDYPYFLVSR